MPPIAPLSSGTRTPRNAARLVSRSEGDEPRYTSGRGEPPAVCQLLDEPSVTVAVWVVPLRV
ncbi:MAG: hypothetical protein QOE24_917 [Frankiales bacterium]|nr:hypothetical protein [Frankiales bacterium]